MLKVIRRLCSEQSGAVISAELVLVLTILVLSMIVGLTAVSHAVNAELEDIAEAFGAVSQSYQYHGLGVCNASWNGSSFDDKVDGMLCDCTDLVTKVDHFDPAGKCE